MKKENTSESESYKKINLETYYRKGSFTNFSEGPKCSLSVTSKIDVTDLYNWSKKYGTKFYINFLYALSKALNSRDDYKMEYRWQTKELICWEKVNPCHYIFLKKKKSARRFIQNIFLIIKNSMKELQKIFRKQKKGALM